MCPVDGGPDFATCKKCEECALVKAWRPRQKPAEPKAWQLIAAGLLLLTIDVIESIKDWRVT